jgi:hypothetical protein
MPVVAFMEAYKDSNGIWMDYISEEVKLPSGNMWKTVNKMIKGIRTAVVQPIRLQNDYSNYMQRQGYFRPTKRCPQSENACPDKRL